MSLYEKTRNEKDPFLREIWAAGYDEVYKDHVRNQTVLTRNVDSYEKRIPIIGLGHSYTFKGANMGEGQTHWWLCESDGSCKRFCELISPDDNSLAIQKYCVPCIDQFLTSKSIMKKLILSVAAIVALTAATVFAYTAITPPRCTGSKNCTACKNCNGCQHCHKNGGTCGVCRQYIS